MTAYIFVKIIDKRFKYYLNERGGWEGLINNGKKNHDYLKLSNDLLRLRVKYPADKIDYIDI